MNPHSDGPKSPGRVKPQGEDSGRVTEGFQSRQRSAIVVAIHHREVDKVAEFLNHGIGEKISKLIVANFGLEPIPRPARLDGRVSFEEIRVHRPGVSNIVDPLSTASAKKILSKIQRSRKGIEILFVTAQYGHRGSFFLAGQDFEKIKIIFVPEGTGVLENDSFRHLTWLAAIRAYAGIVFDGLMSRSKKSEVKFSFKRLILLMLNPSRAWFKNFDSASRPTLKCDLLVSDWGHPSIPGVQPKSIVKPGSGFSPTDRRKCAGYLVVHAPIPLPEKVWILVITRLLEMGAKQVFLAAHPVNDGFGELVSAAMCYPQLEVTILEDYYPLERHLEKVEYTGIVGFFSSILVYAGANFPWQPVYCASRLVENLLPSVVSELRPQRLALFSEIIPRVEGCVVQEL